MAKYAYVCTLCDHLATRHYLTPGAPLVEGPYRCSYSTCTCEISQTDPLHGIDEATFNRVHLPHLDEYVSEARDA
jgi:hypothetical protein